MADFGWMYDDGPGGFNEECTPSDQSGCWGHRENILADYGAQPALGIGVLTTTTPAQLPGYPPTVTIVMTQLFTSGPIGTIAYKLPS
jgi:hypothetical protein